MATIREELDWQIYFKKDDDKNPKPFFWIKKNGEIDENSPLTFRSAYKHIKNALEEEEKEKNLKQIKEFKAGHRKKIFTQKDVEEIKEMKNNGMSNCKIAKKYKCSEKTIRNYLKNNLYQY